MPSRHRTIRLINWGIGILALIAVGFLLGHLAFSGELTSAAVPVAGEDEGSQLWYCSMHPQIIREGLGLCPICEMDPVTTESLGYVAAEPAEQLPPMCPVMGGPIDPNVYVEYEGKRVYFCCQGCDDQFLADPERYLDKRPQFNDPNDATDVQMNHTNHEP